MSRTICPAHSTEWSSHRTVLAAAPIYTEVFVVEFSKNLKTLMETRGVTAATVCKATKIAKSTLSEWLQGRQPKLDESLVRLARYFGVTVEQLILGGDPTSDGEEVIQAVLNGADDGFVEVHSGIYRLRVEKLVGGARKKNGQ